MALVLDGEGSISGFNIISVDSAFDIGTVKIRDSSGAASFKDSDGNSIAIKSSSINTGGITAGSVTATDLSVGNITTTGYLRGPSTLTIDPSEHDSSTGTLRVRGNLTVDGTTTTINSTTVTTADKNIVIAQGAVDSAAADGAGITVDTVNASLTYSHNDADWKFNRGLEITSGDLHISKLNSKLTLGLTLNNTSGDLGIKSSTPQFTMEPTSDAQSSRIQFSKQDGTLWGSIFGLNAGEQLQYSAATHRFKTASAERMRIDSDGHLFINKNSTSLSTVGHEFGSSGYAYHTRNAANPLYINRTTDDGDIVRLYKDGSVIGSFGSNSASGTPVLDISANATSGIMRMMSSGTERMRIDASGNVLVGGTTNRNRKFVVEGTGDLAVLYSTNDGAGGAQLDFIQNSSSKAADDAVGIVNFSTDTRQFSSIRGIAHDHSNGYGQLRFGVRQNTSTYNHDAMVINYNGHVGIGTTSPNARLHVRDDVGSDSIMRIRNENTTSRTTTLQLEDYSGALADGVLKFVFPTAGTTTGSYLALLYNSAGLYIAPGGNVGIGTDSPTVGLELSGAGNDARMKLINGSDQINFGLWDNTNYRLEGDANRKILITSYHTDGIHLGGSGGSDLIVKGGNVGIGLAPTNVGVYKTLEIGQKSGSKRGRIQFNTDQGNITLFSYESGTQPYLGVYTDHASGTYIARFDSHGLKFGQDTAAANALDDYEEGTWTPTTPNGSWTVHEATYTKIGRFVHCRAYVTAGSSGITSADFGGLPFSVFGSYGSGIVGYNNYQSGEVISVLVQANTLFNFRIGQTQVGVSANGSAMFAFQYETS